MIAKPSRDRRSASGVGDYTTPKRFTPGLELVLTSISVTLVYVGDGIRFRRGARLNLEDQHK